MTLKLGETAPERKGAGISDIIRSTSSSSNVLLCCASCSQDRIEPRSLPGCRSLGRRNGELSVDEGGAGEAYERLARVGRKPGREGVCGLLVSPPFGRALGIAGVGADGEATEPSMNSTSSASMLSTLLSCVMILGVGVAGTDAPRVWMIGPEPPCLRADIRPRGDSGGAGIEPRRGLGLPLTLCKRRELEPLRMLPKIVGVEGELDGRDAPEPEDEEDGGRGRPARTDPDPDTGGVEVLLNFEALVEVVRTDDGDDWGFVGPLSFFSGVDDLTLIAAVRLTFSALG